MLKRLITVIALLAITVMSLAQEAKDVKFSYTEASTLTMVGKMFPDTPKPYERLDYEKHKGFNEKDISLVKMSSGLAVSFKTDSPIITVRGRMESFRAAGDPHAHRGFDLYIKKDGKWLWAGCSTLSEDLSKTGGGTLVQYMDGTMKECLMYFPTYACVTSVKIGIKEGCRIEAGEQPFRHRVAIFGSSFTHGMGATRSGLTYPAIFTRKTGIQLLSMGVSGDCRMQPQFANAFKDADVEAFIFDSFSNGSAKTVEQSLFKFIETIQAAHPGKPLIFQRTIWRERRNFNSKVETDEKTKADMAEKLMAEALKKYKDVYFITPCATSKDHETTEDGTHPGDYGYYLWAESIVKPVTKILAKYGIK